MAARTLTALTPPPSYPAYSCAANPLWGVVGIVQAADGIRFVAVGNDARALAAHLARYAAERASLVLWPRDAAVVRCAAVAGNDALAVERYFAAVGTRWDDEHLTVAELRGDPFAGGAVTAYIRPDDRSSTFRPSDHAQVREHSRDRRQHASR